MAFRFPYVRVGIGARDGRVLQELVDTIDEIHGIFDGVVLTEFTGDGCCCPRCCVVPRLTWRNQFGLGWKAVASQQRRSSNCSRSSLRVVCSGSHARNGGESGDRGVGWSTLGIRALPGYMVSDGRSGTIRYGFRRGISPTASRWRHHAVAWALPTQPFRSVDLAQLAQRHRRGRSIHGRR